MRALITAILSWVAASGLEFKVKGGFDFVNWDTDPLDDHGHGARGRVAAANGANLKVLAPEAGCYHGFKVLDSNGSGFDSWVMKAGELRERWIPIKNPSTDDKMHVVNMSLREKWSS